jgi:transcriptional regulator with XRE-family HTH domain
MLVKLGQRLAEARGKKGLSLETAARSAKISGAYLHKLEHGTVDNPSPRVLARIALALDLSYLRLMELAGYLDETQLTKIQGRDSPPKPHPLEGRKLTPGEWRTVGEFIDKILAERKRTP